jgi:hypothetical protein
MNRYANMCVSEKMRSENFVKTVSVGDKMWPRGQFHELTVNLTITEGHSIIYYEGSARGHIFPFPEDFYTGLALWWKRFKAKR